MDKLAFRLKEFLKIAGIGKDAAYQAIREGRLVARKQGKLTIILASDAERFLASLPRLELCGQDATFNLSSGAQQPNGADRPGRRRLSP